MQDSEAFDVSSAKVLPEFESNENHARKVGFGEQWHFGEQMHEKSWKPFATTCSAKSRPVVMCYRPNQPNSSLSDQRFTWSHQQAFKAPNVIRNPNKVARRRIYCDLWTRSATIIRCDGCMRWTSCLLENDRLLRLQEVRWTVQFTQYTCTSTKSLRLIVQVECPPDSRFPKFSRLRIL